MASISVLLELAEGVFIANARHEGIDIAKGESRCPRCAVGRSISRAVKRLGLHDCTLEVDVVPLNDDVVEGTDEEFRHLFGV